MILVLSSTLNYSAFERNCGIVVKPVRGMKMVFKIKNTKYLFMLDKCLSVFSWYSEILPVWNTIVGMN